MLTLHLWKGKVSPMKKRRTIGIKINVFLVLMIILVAAVMIISSYFINASQVDQHFSDMDISLCKTMLNLVDTEYISTLADEIQTDEYQTIYKKAVEEEDDTPIIDWLKEKGYYDQYMSTLDIMERFQRDMGIEYVYFFSCVGKNSYAIIDPKEDMFYLGYFYPNENEFEDFTTNIHIDPTINYSDEYGWLMSGYEAVLNSAGEPKASIGVDINLDTVMAERTSFLITLIITSVILIIFAVIIGIFTAFRTLVRPLTVLSLDMGKFSPIADADYETCQVLDVTYKKNNEIGTLYSGIHDMQINIVDYLNDITRVTAEKERMTAELDVAARMQAGIVPTDFPTRDDIRIYATMSPAREMGGDFYDFFQVDEDHIALVMADVSGKGVPAAMFMIVAKVILKNRTINRKELNSSPAQILFEVNNMLCADNPSNLFVTVWFGILTLSDGTLISSNAGHDFPAILRGSGDYIITTEDNMPPLATVEDLEYTDDTIQLEKGDRLFLYTDGVPEAKSEEGERFGLERMMDVLNRDKSLSPEQLLTMMKHEIDTFTGDIAPFDDITMMSVRYDG